MISGSADSKGKTIRQTFWEFVVRGTPNECWLWKGKTDDHGYGVRTINGQYWRSNRLAWVVLVGDIPKDMSVLHKCDNTSCCNPNHLKLGTHADNMADAVSTGRMRGVRNGRAKISDEIVAAIRASHKAGVQQKELVKMFGISKSQVSRICLGERWKHVG